MGRVADFLSRAERSVFEPETLPAGAVLGLALVPSLLAGLAFFRAAGAEALAIAIAAGAVLQVGAWRLRLGRCVTPTVAAVVAVSLLGPGAPLAWVAVAAVLGGSLELARLRWTRDTRLQTGLLAGAAVFLASSGVTAAYLNPGRLRPLSEPIRLWLDFSAPGAAPIDPVRLYVGNVPGPMFATSLLAVVIGAAWLWYARRLSLAVVLAFLAGAAIPIVLWRWNPGYQLDSGPTWFVVALLLADRESLPRSRASRPLLGLAAGVVGIGLRKEGLGIEAILLAGAGLQLAMASVEGAEWLVVHRDGIAVAAGALRRGAVRLTGRRTAA